MFGFKNKRLVKELQKKTEALDTRVCIIEARFIQQDENEKRNSIKEACDKHGLDVSVGQAFGGLRATIKKGDITIKELNVYEGNKAYRRLNIYAMILNYIHLEYGKILSLNNPLIKEKVKKDVKTVTITKRKR